MSTLQNGDENRAMTLTETGQAEMMDLFKNMKKKSSRLLGVFGAAQFIIGALCIVINGVTLGIFFNNPSSFIPILGHGFLPGLTFIVAGAIGIAAGTVKKKCLVVSSNVLCIISASLCSYLFICSVIGASVSSNRCYYRSDAYAYYTCKLEQDRTIAFEAVLAILAILEIGCAIGSSVVTCSIGACCCDCDCGCCCPPIVFQEPINNCNGSTQELRENGSTQELSGVPIYCPSHRPKATGVSYQQPATFVVNPSQPAYYMPVANQMTIPSGQQQPVILLNPNQMMAQYNPQQMTALSNWGNSEMRSPTVECEYEPLTLNTAKR